MKTTYRLETLFQDLVREVLDGPLVDENGLLWAVLLHTHNIRLEELCVTDVPEHAEFEALTLRGAAAAVADLWPDRRDERADYLYWYRKLLALRNPDDVSVLTRPQRDKLEQLRLKLNNHPVVADVFPGPLSDDTGTEPSVNTSP